MPNIPSFDEYLGSLGHLTAHVDPTASSPDAEELKTAAASLAGLPEVTRETLADWVQDHPSWVPALGLSVGLSQEKLKNQLNHHLGSSGWRTLAKTRPFELIDALDEYFDVIRLVKAQRGRRYDFGDLLVARAGTRQTAARAGASGRKVEDDIEEIVAHLGLPYDVRTRFVGRGGRTAPCDLVIPNTSDAAIAVAAKGFDSTGSKLTDAVREILEMAEVRTPRQFIIAVIDGIGWKMRQADLKRIYDLWASDQIDGMYTLATLDAFRSDVESAAQLRGFLPR
ncbi:hypothetical protein ACH4PW_37010 [Streptomyces sp. NPDC017082]|uniref:hypothetical protein n=1 Tax=Streptomyces sp. NPDC017082 TaxID=3364974 RepID=UPI00379FD81A